MSDKLEYGLRVAQHLKIYVEIPANTTADREMIRLR